MIWLEKVPRLSPLSTDGTQHGCLNVDFTRVQEPDTMIGVWLAEMVYKAHPLILLLLFSRDTFHIS